MIDNLLPYPDYKDSGVEWLGKIPSHWEIRRLKYWVKINQNVLPENSPPNYEFDYIDISSVGTGRLIAKPQRIVFSNAPSRARRLLKHGDTIFSTVRTYLKATYFVKQVSDNLIASTGFAVLSPSQSTHSKFVFYFSQSDIFTNRVTAESVGIAYPAISESKLSSLLVAIPPLEEQKTIARSLDYADKRIRKAIQLKQKQIKLLEEYKQALIHEAVTGQIDVRTGQPYPAYKDSGVEWLGKIPSHWELVRLKRICSKSALYGANIPSSEYTSSGVRFIRTTDITPAGELKKSGVYVSKEIVRDYILQSDDLLISRSGTVGRAFLLDESRHGVCAYAGYLVRFVPNQHLVNPSYLFQFTHTDSFSGFLTVMAISSTIENVNGEKYANCPIPHPSIEEQKTIADYIDEQTSKIDKIISSARRQIELLQEYRTRLIADVVTGKVDVREIGNKLPQESADSEPLEELATEEEATEEVNNEE